MDSPQVTPNSHQNPSHLKDPLEFPAHLVACMSGWTPRHPKRWGFPRQPHPPQSSDLQVQEQAMQPPAEEKPQTCIPGAAGLPKATSQVPHQQQHLWKLPLRAQEPPTVAEAPSELSTVEDALSAKENPVTPLEDTTVSLSYRTGCCSCEWIRERQFKNSDVVSPYPQAQLPPALTPLEPGHRPVS